MLIEMSEDGKELLKRAQFPHGYASSKFQFIPSSDTNLPELIASATIHLKLFRYDSRTQQITEECNLCSVGYFKLIKRVFSEKIQCLFSAVNGFRLE